MKRILIWICSFILMIFMTACDNNEGPFDVKKENGNLVLYSNGKLAKGWVEENNINFDTGITTKVSEIEYDKGLPTGKFKYYDDNGVMIWDANLKEDGDLFKGTITFSGSFYYSSFLGKNFNGEMKGTFAINPNWIVGKRGKFDPINFFEKTAVDATYDGNDAKGKYKNKKPDGEWNYYYEDGQLGKKGNYKNGKEDGVFESYYKNGQLYERIEYKNGEKDGIYEEYFEDGQLHIRENYKNGKEDGVFERYYRNGQLYIRENYKNGKESGPFERYHEGGQLIIKGEI